MQAVGMHAKQNPASWVLCLSNVPVSPGECLMVLLPLPTVPVRSPHRLHQSPLQLQRKSTINISQTL